VLQGAAQASFTAAATTAQLLLNGQAGFTDIAVLAVGGDSYIFYDPGSASPLEAIRLIAVANPAVIAMDDFV